ncbi:MAG TPA: hypothetical protein VNE71_01915, partial [Myxococcota bacterium]|nr:hypothetical protein [Myxococcota bacterium]
RLAHAAHSFDATRLAEAGEVAFETAPGAAPAARSQRYFAKPGAAYHLPGSSPRGDYVVFALETRPEGVTLLEPATTPPARGARVAILGLGEDALERTLPGTVEKSGAESITVDLDARADLRGWGGAPVVLADSGQVIGLLHAAWPKGDRMSTTIGPIGGAASTLAEPYEEGLGRLFATLAPPRSAASSLRLRQREEAGIPLAKLSPDAIAERLERALGADAQPPPATSPLRVTIESPEPEAIFTDAAGAFVAGRALTGNSAEGRFDVYLVVDTSRSAVQPSGADVDGDGEIGTSTSTPDRESSDRGDTILAAECAAAVKVVDGLDPKRTRVGILSFAGDAVATNVRELVQPRVLRAVQLHEPLTSDYRRVRTALGDLAESEPRGSTHMAAGIDLATIELLGLPGAIGKADPDSTKMILFFTDGQPTLPYLGNDRLNVGAVIRAAERASRAGVRIHSFAIGPEALAGPIAAVEMAEITHGLFTPVPDPARLTEFVDAILFTAVAEVKVRNTTASADAHEVHLHADGSWEALVPLSVGKNLLEVRARSSAGEETAERILVHYAPGSARAALPAEYLDKYNRLLQRRLLTITAEQRERTRKELVLEIERERSAALERAALQRKELSIRVEAPTEP